MRGTNWGYGQPVFSYSYLPQQLTYKTDFGVLPVWLQIEGHRIQLNSAKYTEMHTSYFRAEKTVFTYVYC